MASFQLSRGDLRGSVNAHEVQTLHDRDLIERHLSKEPILHLYELGDLDPLTWPRTVWYGSDDLEAVLLVYAADLPALLGMDDTAAGRKLLQEAAPLLPCRFHAQLAPGLVETLAKHYRLQGQMTTLRMALERPDALPETDPAVETLTTAHLEELKSFYEESYPENWFDPGMVVTERYVGLRREGRLACVAGVHVWSPRYRVSALGNIATHPDFRGEGLATRVVGTLCRRLLQDVEHIGLNVRASNEPALRCYRALGFEVKASFEELDASPLELTSEE